MADLVKIFYEVGKVFENEGIENYNQIYYRGIKKIVTIELTDKNYKPEEYDSNRIVHRFFLRVTSSRGGNLYPFLFLNGNIDSGIKNSFKNMYKYIDDENRKVLKSIESIIDYKKLKEVLKNYINKNKKEKNIYLGVIYDGKTFNELFPDIAYSYAEKVCNGETEKNLECYIDGNSRIGYDPKLNFCSIDDLPNNLKKNTKYRLLPLSKEAACLVKQGFERIFERQIFRFYLFGHSYYLLPTLF
ncbi:MAG: TM1802 family CRISPR-associated protein, partial [Hydrogenimonas sp.]|nr:TM1802 family CRISPR-associated protein [Hydrogenimonas sp.]